MCYRKLNVFCFSRLLRQHPLSVDKNCFAKVVPLWIYHYQHVAVFELPAKKKKIQMEFYSTCFGAGALNCSLSSFQVPGNSVPVSLSFITPLYELLPIFPTCCLLISLHSLEAPSSYFYFSLILLSLDGRGLHKCKE